MRQRQQKIDQALCDGRPFDVGQGVQGSRGRVQHPREHIGKTAGRDHARFAQSRLAGDPSMQRT